MTIALITLIVGFFLVPETRLISIWDEVDDGAHPPGQARASASVASASGNTHSANQAK